MTPIDLVVDGVRLNAVESGTGDPLILCHGWGACVPFWKETIPPLAAKHRVIAFDWPGFGTSDSVGPFTIERYVSLLGKIMDALGLRAATIVGHSMGGAIATAFALAHPERVARLVQVCAPIDGATAFPWYIVLASWPIIRWLVFLFGKIRWIRRVSARIFTSTVPMFAEVIDLAGRIPYWRSSAPSGRCDRRDCRSRDSPFRRTRSSADATASCDPRRPSCSAPRQASRSLRSRIAGTARPSNAPLISCVTSRRSSPRRGLQPLRTQHLALPPCLRNRPKSTPPPSNQVRGVIP